MTAHVLAGPHESFNLRAAYLMAQAAELAYGPPAAIEADVLARQAFARFEYCEQDDTQAFVASSAATTLVAFRGTESDRVGDWLVDADVALVDGPLGGKVHAGFYDALSDVWQFLDRAVKRFDPQGRKPLWITGHSLGGALATLAAARWAERGQSIHGVYTFGQPRAGDRTFVRNFDFSLKAVSFRFVNNNDLVTRLPPRSLGYSHQGIFKYFTESGALSDDLSWWDLFAQRWTYNLEVLLAATSSDGIADHRMTEYRARVGLALGIGRPPESAATVDREPAILQLSSRPNEPIRPRRRAA